MGQLNETAQSTNGCKPKTQLSTEDTTFDCISRREAIDVLKMGEEFLNRALDNTDIVGAEREKYEWGLGLIESCISDMKELPSVQPERKTGKWIVDGVRFKGGHDWMHCSECGRETLNTPIERTNYCPNCGARMEE